MVSVNIEAKKTVDVMIEKADALNIAVETLENGATVLDCGVNVDGSFKAGELYTKVCLGGLADVGISIPGDLSEKFALPSVKIKTDSPSISTLGSQKAGWSVSVGDFFALGSGPARAIALKPAETYEEIGYEDKEADLAILTLEADVLPGEDVAQYIADECNVDVKNVYLLVAPTSSLVGSIQISGRVVENGTYKMLEAIKFDVTKVKHAAGIAPMTQMDLKLWVKPTMQYYSVEEPTTTLNLMKTMTLLMLQLNYHLPQLMDMVNHSSMYSKKLNSTSTKSTKECSLLLKL